MATKIVTKNSSTASAVPTASDLVQGELAVNVADKRLFTEDNGGSIIELGTNPSTLTVDTDTLAVDSTNNRVGIGTTSPATDLDVRNNISMGDGTSVTNLSMTRNSANYITAPNASGYLVFRTGGATERMRIDSSGNVMAGTTTAPAALATSTDSSDTGMSVSQTGRVTFASNNTYIMTLNRYSSNGVILRFSKDGVLTGSISTNGSNLPSDRNFKKNISDLALGLDFVNSLSPKTYNFNIDDEGQPVMTGLIAQEVEAALTAAGIEHNSMTLLQYEPTENVNDSDYQMDYVKFVPILINSIKEQQTLIDSLTARIAALENN